MSRKTVNPTLKGNQYIRLWYRYMRYICTINKISMLEAMEQFGYRYRTLYLNKFLLNRVKNYALSQTMNYTPSKR